MKKHLDIKIEGNLTQTDFNYYCQIGAFKHNINAVYVNGNTRDVDISAEGFEADLENYITYLQEGPLQKFIETFEISEGSFQNYKGFISKRHKQEPKKSLISKIFKK